MAIDPHWGLTGPIGILADDLTGCGDTALQFHAPHQPAWIVPDWAAPFQPPAAFAALAVNTESRHLLPDDAGAVVDRAARGLQRAGCTRFYKKVDSTLRGNLATEALYALNALRYEIAIVAPAFPEAGRLTVGGYQLVAGVPVSVSPYGRDPLSPVKHSHLPTLLEEATGERVAHATLSAVMAGPDAVARTIALAIEARTRLLVVDAARPEDLATLARAMALTPYKLLPVGSAGLAKAIARPPVLLGGPAKSSPTPAPSGPPVLIVSGSLNPVTLAQVAAASKRAVLVEADAPALVLGDPGAFDKLARQVLQPLLAGQDVVLATATEGRAAKRTSELGRQLGLAAAHTGAELVTAIGRVVATVVAQAPIAGLVLAGGETALGVCRALGNRPMRIVEELLPAIPLTRIERPEGALRVVTKSGGFGEHDALVVLADRLRRMGARQV